MGHQDRQPLCTGEGAAEGLVGEGEGGNGSEKSREILQEDLETLLRQ